MADPTPPTSDPDVQTLQIDGHDVTYTDEGEGDVVVVLLHGLPGSVRDFRYLAPQLGSVRRVRIDLPGYGGTSRQGKRVWYPDERAALVVKVLDALGLERLVIVGHSMGGVVATAVACALPDTVVGLGLLASPGVRPHRGFLSARLDWVSRLLRVPGLPTVLKGAVQRGFRAAGFPKRTPYDVMVSSMVDAGVLNFEVHGRWLRTLRQPTLLAWAADDPLVEHAIGVELTGVVPAGPRCVWPTGGHNVQKTHAAELGEALTAFARAVCGLREG
jgi:pimeloyl-ACP methyl ester carboxylesterase